MIHFRVNDVTGEVACRSNTANISTNVALESDCDDCRAAVNIGPRSQPGCHLRKYLDYTPEPHPQADEIMRYVDERRRNVTRKGRRR